MKKKQTKKEPVLVKSYKNEEWKKIKDFKSSPNKYYLISSKGRIKSKDKKSKDEQLIKGTYTKKGGYHQFNVKTGDNKRKSFYVHKQVAALFLGKKKKNQIYVCHKNGDHKNNKVSNLMWASKEEWSKLHKKLGTFAAVNRDPLANSKLTIAKVKQIKKSLKAGRKTKASLAAKYGVSATQINRIATGENWSSVEI